MITSLNINPHSVSRGKELLKAAQLLKTISCEIMKQSTCFHKNEVTSKNVLCLTYLLLYPECLEQMAGTVKALKDCWVNKWMMSFMPHLTKYGSRESQNSMRQWNSDWYERSKLRNKSKKYCSGERRGVFDWHAVNSPLLLKWAILTSLGE